MPDLCRVPVQALYAWWQFDLCDVFIELVKPVVQREEASAPNLAAGAKDAHRQALWLCLDAGLRCAAEPLPVCGPEQPRRQLSCPMKFLPLTACTPEPQMGRCRIPLCGAAAQLRNHVSVRRCA
jgi:valyl-tRNA synthetase